LIDQKVLEEGIRVSAAPFPRREMAHQRSESTFDEVKEDGHHSEGGIGAAAGRPSPDHVLGAAVASCRLAILT